jgi:molybdopterin-guanine dinucleotide biosynthesis protein A
MLSAAILVGGRSRRFNGRDKHGLIVERRRILDRRIAELSGVADEVLVVGESATCPPHAGARAVPDRVPGCGPLGGLHTALAEAKGKAVLVVACDMPYLSSPFLSYLLGLTRGAEAVVPAPIAAIITLCAAYARGCAAVVGRHLAEQRLRLTDLFEDLRIRVVTADEIGAFGDDHRLLANVNTPGELASLAALKGYEP